MQVTPKPGRTKLSLETQTTWWVQTVCLCSLTTSEEGNSWPVTECDKQGSLYAPAVLLLPPQWQAYYAQWSTNLIFSRCLLCPKFEFEKKEIIENGKPTHKESRRSPASPRLYSCPFLSFCFGAFKACKKWRFNKLFKQRNWSWNAWPVPQIEKSHFDILANFVNG